MNNDVKNVLDSAAAKGKLEDLLYGDKPATEDPFQAIADKRAKKVLKKNAREIKRLKAHAEKCLFELNKEGYIYSIGKIRTIIRKPLNRAALEALYETSVERIVELAKTEINKQK